MPPPRTCAAPLCALVFPVAVGLMAVRAEPGRLIAPAASIGKLIVFPRWKCPLYRIIFPIRRVCC